MHRHHLLALAGCTLVSAIALTDAVTTARTGHNSVFADGPTAVVVATSLVHGLTYLALLAVLVRERARFTEAGVVARASRRVLQLCLALLSVVFLAVEPVLRIGGVDPDADSAVAVGYGIVATTTLLLMFLAGSALGLALLRHNPLGLGGRILGPLLLVVLGTLALGFVAPEWSHPAYAETVINFGIALLGVRVGERVPAGR